MAKKFNDADKVSWKYGKGLATGKIQQAKAARMTLKSQGKTVVRNGTEDNPAYKIKQKDGTLVLKLQSELSKLKKV